MKSISSDLHKNTGEKVKQNKTYDFINFYQPASETNVRLLEKRKSDDGSSKENNNTNATSSPHKKKKKSKRDSINTTQVAVELSIPNTSEILNDSKVTSTPNVKDKKNKNVKSIMKASLTDNSLDVSTITITSKPKKRNKSVSFMLDENEEIVVKKSKSADSLQKSKTELKDIKKKIHKKKIYIDKVNVSTSSSRVEIDKPGNSTNHKTKVVFDTQPDETNVSVRQTVDKEKKMHKKSKKKPTEVQELVVDEEIDGTNINLTNKKVKKLKSKKTKNNTEQTETDKEIKPEVIAQDLENLNIGDNTHTLTNLLDEMTVKDKNKRKKNKDKKDLNTGNTSNKTDSVEAQTEKKKEKVKWNKAETKEEKEKVIYNKAETEQEKEKVKWNKRKWNKDKKGLVNDVSTTIIIENLPLKIMCNYRKLLTDHFGKFGQIKQVGVAELYSIEDPKAFTTTICFDSEDAVEKALQEDNTLFEESRIRVKRHLPPTQTTLVVKSYGALSEPALSSVFADAGRIRSIRRLVKGKKARSTVFIEFDGPEAVERAIKLAEGVRIERKKIFAFKYEIRYKNKKRETENGDNDVSDDSEE